MGATGAPSLIEKIIINNDRNNNDAAKGRGSWERIRWPDAKFEVTSAKSDLRNEQQPEKREESREQREERWAPLEQRCAGDIGLLFLFYFSSAVGSRDGSCNPRMGATCAPSLVEKIMINNDRNNNDAAKGRGSWERIRWPDAKFEVTGAKCDLVRSEVSSEAADHAGYYFILFCIRCRLPRRQPQSANGCDGSPTSSIIRSIAHLLAR